MIPGTRASEKAETTGYDEYIKLLAEEMESYTRPTVFLHGDTHRFRVDQPLFSAKNNRRFENFTRVETFGSPDTHWIRVTVDPSGRPGVLLQSGNSCRKCARSPNRTALTIAPATPAPQRDRPPEGVDNGSQLHGRLVWQFSVDAIRRGTPN